MRHLLAFVFVALAQTAHGQTLPPYTTNSTISWDAPADVTSVTDAQAATYRAYVTGVSGGTVLAHTCGVPVAPDTKASCSAKAPASIVPALNGRAVSLTVTAAGLVTNPDGTTTQVEGPQSLPFAAGRPYGAPGRPRLTP